MSWKAGQRELASTDLISHRVAYHRELFIAFNVLKHHSFIRVRYGTLSNCQGIAFRMFFRFLNHLELV